MLVGASTPDRAVRQEIDSMHGTHARIHNILHVEDGLRCQAEHWPGGTHRRRPDSQLHSRGVQARGPGCSVSHHPDGRTGSARNVDGLPSQGRKADGSVVRGARAIAHLAHVEPDHAHLAGSIHEATDVDHCRDTRLEAAAVILRGLWDILSVCHLVVVHGALEGVAERRSRGLPTRHRWAATLRCRRPGVVADQVTCVRGGDCRVIDVKLGLLDRGVDLIALGELVCAGAALELPSGKLDDLEVATDPGNGYSLLLPARLHNHHAGLGAQVAGPLRRVAVIILAASGAGLRPEDAVGRVVLVLLRVAVGCLVVQPVRGVAAELVLRVAGWDLQLEPLDAVEVLLEDGGGLLVAQLAAQRLEVGDKVRMRSCAHLLAGRRQARFLHEARRLSFSLCLCRRLELLHLGGVLDAQVGFALSNVAVMRIDLILVLIAVCNHTLDYGAVDLVPDLLDVRGLPRVILADTPRCVCPIITSECLAHVLLGHLLRLGLELHEAQFDALSVRFPRRGEGVRVRGFKPVRLHQQGARRACSTGLALAVLDRGQCDGGQACHPPEQPRHVERDAGREQ
mmetsp:Transcript_90022/g.280180  ORF Transcript_90022/g.280180 Transcript_90022/m.280180 type:complete len:568 (+) Transcript_90022:861-2564(+)